MAAEHPYVTTIKRYYEGCNLADFDIIRETFTEDVVHYFTHAPVVRGGDALAHFWTRVVPRMAITSRSTTPSSKTRKRLSNGH